MPPAPCPGPTTLWPKRKARPGRNQWQLEELLPCLRTGVGAGEHSPLGEGTREQSGVQQGRIQGTSHGRLHASPGSPLEGENGLNTQSSRGLLQTDSRRKLAPHTAGTLPQSSPQSRQSSLSVEAGRHRLCGDGSRTPPMHIVLPGFWLPVPALAHTPARGRSTDCREARRQPDRSHRSSSPSRPQHNLGCWGRGSKVRGEMCQRQPHLPSHQDSPSLKML